MLHHSDCFVVAVKLFGLYFFMPSLPNSIGEIIMFFMLSRCLVHPSVCPVKYCYHDMLMNGSKKFDKTDMEYSLAHTDDLIRF